MLSAYFFLSVERVLALGGRDLKAIAAALAVCTSLKASQFFVFQNVLIDIWLFSWLRLVFTDGTNAGGQCSLQSLAQVSNLWMLDQRRRTLLTPEKPIVFRRPAQFSCTCVHIIVKIHRRKTAIRHGKPRSCKQPTLVFGLPE